eukprot:203573-Chlamydomonas_euryale.AAC.1
MLGNLGFRGQGGAEWDHEKLSPEVSTLSRQPPGFGRRQGEIGGSSPEHREGRRSVGRRSMDRRSVGRSSAR